MQGLNRWENGWSVAGVVLLVAGGLIWLLGRIPGLNKLPGALQI